MRTSITTNHGTYHGRSVETIVRRIYGPRAYVNGDFIVRPGTGGAGHNVLARLKNWEGIYAAHDIGRVASRPQAEADAYREAITRNSAPREGRQAFMHVAGHIVGRTTGPVWRQFYVITPGGRLGLIDDADAPMSDARNVTPEMIPAIIAAVWKWED